MYSVVLLMALSGGAEAPDCHKHSCHGCSGGCSGYVATCYGCSGGCHGGGGLFHHKRSCHGCDGGCHGYYGGCWGGGCYGGGCWGGGCYGGAVMYPCAGYGYPGCAGGVMYPPMMDGGKPGGEKIKDMPKEKEKGKEEVSAPATIVLSLPADAQVTLDGAATTSTSATRTFVTPELAPAAEFVYTLSAKIVRNGQTLTVTEKVSVRAGEETRLDLGTEKFTALTVAAK